MISGIDKCIAPKKGKKNKKSILFKLEKKLKDGLIK